MNEEVGLTPCPFCCSSQLRKSNSLNFDKKQEKILLQCSCVQCMNCGAYGPMITFVKDPVKGWNERK